MVELDAHWSTDRGEHQQDLRGSVVATVRPPLNDFNTQTYHLQLSAPLKLSVAPHVPPHCSTVLTPVSFIKNADVAGRTAGATVLCKLDS